MASRPMPRLILVRHGETEWSKNGRHTGRTDIPLTKRGEEQIKDKAEIIVGPGKLIDTANLEVFFVSPRQRAHKTFHLLTEHLPETPPHILLEDVVEWDYGDYEGLFSHEIKAKAGPSWNIWVDGCAGGESPHDVTRRVDLVIEKVRERHRLYKDEGKCFRDVVIIAHGHFNRCMIARWLNMPLKEGTMFTFDAGGVAVLGYNHNNLAEPALNALNVTTYG
ncbi:histidine phosphatase superfamily [Vararia minispora EC-137]|uniref:Histidine phosphatase superfamily n=1 Tax=Vararia minispora EC-137 TaxID=1314806 RepID=A0ACB8QY80_9AGAM|nr:histidine phosphatase superfamily [Vararia minispora EC-137]